MKNCSQLLVKISAIYADNAFQFKPLIAFCKAEGIRLTFRASRLSRSVIVERYHRSLHAKIYSMTKEPRSWNVYLSQAVFSLNAQVHDSTGFTPYYLMFGHDHPVLANHTEDTSDEKRLQIWNDCKFIARILSDTEKLRHADTKYQYPTLPVDTEILIKYDPSKNGKYLKANVLRDHGGAEVTVQLQNKAMKLKVHKGVIYVEKGSAGYQAVFYPPKSLEPEEPTQIPREEEPMEPRYRLRKRHEEDNIAKRANEQIQNDSDLQQDDFFIDISQFGIPKNMAAYFTVPNGTRIEKTTDRSRRMRSGKCVSFEI